MPLSDVTVLDISRFLPGPQCAAFLGDYGARVIRVETPRHAEARDRAFGLEGASEAERDRLRTTELTGRGKERREIDFFSDDGRQELMRMAAEADVFIHDYRAGAISAAGLGYEALSEINPRLVYVAISLTGAEGPRAGAPGHDPVALALAGALARTGETPHLVGFPAADTVTASQAALAVMVALRKRDKTGVGAFLDVAMSDCALTLMASVFGRQQRTGHEPPLEFAVADNAVFETSDGRHVVATNMERAYWDRFCAAVGRPDLGQRFDGERESLLAELAAIYATRSRDDWDAFAREHDLQIAPVLSPAEAMDEAHHHARGALVRGQNGVVVPGPPVRIGEAAS